MSKELTFGMHEIVRKLPELSFFELGFLRQKIEELEKKTLLDFSDFKFDWISLDQEKISSILFTQDNDFRSFWGTKFYLGYRNNSCIYLFLEKDNFKLITERFGSREIKLTKENVVDFLDFLFLIKYHNIEY